MNSNIHHERSLTEYTVKKFIIPEHVEKAIEEFANEKPVVNVEPKCDTVFKPSKKRKVRFSKVQLVTEIPANFTAVRVKENASASEKPKPELSAEDLDELLTKEGFVEKTFTGSGVTYLEFIKSSIDIELLTITFLGAKKDGLCNVFVDILEEYYPVESKNAKSIYQHTFNRIEQKQFKPFELKLTNPVYLHKDIVYAIRFELMGRQPTMALEKKYLKSNATLEIRRQRAAEIKFDFFGTRAVTSFHTISELRFRLPTFQKIRVKPLWDLHGSIIDMIEACFNFPFHY